MPDLLSTFAPEEGRYTRPLVQTTVTVGYKDPQRGFPTARDRFFVMTARPDHDLQVNGRKVEARSKHPAFDPNGYTEIPGILMHSEFADSIQVRRVMYRSTDLPAPPDTRPVCSFMDGQEMARRHTRDGWQDVLCAGEACRFYQSDNPKSTCKPRSTVAFMLNIPDCPQLLTYWTTASGQNATALEKFRQLVIRQFKELGQPPRWWCLRIRLTLISKTGKGERYPLVEVTPDGPIMDSIRFTLESQALAQRLPTIPTAGLLSATFEDSDADHLAPTRPMILSRPASLETVPDWPPLAFIAGVSLSPAGEPTCPLCSAEMGRIRNRAGSPGWVCSTRPACAGARRWDGSAI